MEVFFTIFIGFQILIGFFFLYPFILYLISSSKKSETNFTPTMTEKGGEHDYAVIVTAYESTALIPSVVDSLLKLNYDNYLIYVIADKCDISALAFPSSKVILIKPHEVLQNNIRSHFYAIDRFRRSHERLTIIDSDNLVHSEYLNELNQFFDLGYTAVQGQRRAKNLDSQFACLDEAGDMFYRYCDRKLLFEAGSSASLAGSGMAFTTKLYIECLGSLQIEGAGFDKILQYELLKKRSQIAFAENAIVFDEKTTKTEQLVKQRARWINTWFKFLVLALDMFVIGIKNFNRNQFLFSFMLLRPPLFVLVLFAAFSLVIDMFIAPVFILYWGIIFTIFVFLVLKSLSYFKADKLIYRSLKSIPQFIYYQVLALLKIRKANQFSVVTKHEYKSNIDDLQP